MNRLLAAIRRIRLPRGRGFVSWLRGLPKGQVIAWAAGFAVAIALMFVVGGLTACWRLTALPGIPPSACPGGGATALGGPEIADGGAAVADLPPAPDVAAPEIEYPKWDGGSRVNLVFFGLRGGETQGEGCPLCTDTIIVFTVDPVSKSAGMISIPRDLYVNIP
ncbi:MAG TPA: LCP family protein, partial [Anaerolineales bacterium]|nr:LCP family protein [Anaerolineales bacterium]